MTPHWSVFFTWWMIAGAILYGLIWWRVLTAGTKAQFAGPASFPLVLYWAIPPTVYLGESWEIWPVVIICCLIALVAFAPIQVFWRAQDRARKEAKRDREQAAEQVIRRLGA